MTTSRKMVKFIQIRRNQILQRLAEIETERREIEAELSAMIGVRVSPFAVVTMGENRRSVFHMNMTETLK